MLRLSFFIRLLVPFAKPSFGEQVGDAIQKRLKPGLRLARRFFVRALLHDEPPSGDGPYEERANVESEKSTTAELE